jgi:hypothetical protein
MTYNRRQKIFAWHQHDTDGEFESVATIPEGDEFGVYFVVKRDIEGEPRRYVERFRSRRFPSQEEVFIVDSGLSYNGPATDTVSGLDHLEGKTVSILADGGPAPQQTVQNGQVSITDPAKKIHVGLPYNCDLEPVGVDLNQSAEAMGRKKSISVLRVRVEETVGIFAGPDANNLQEYKQRSAEPYGEPVAPETGVIEMNIVPQWKHDASVFIRQSEPLPITVLGIVPEVKVAREARLS